MSVLNSFFSRNTFRNCFENGNDDVYNYVINKYIKNDSSDTNLNLISQIYDILKHDYRNEYFYKNTLLNKLLLGVHSLNTTTALTELPIANSKADFVLINGKGVVYEIKTELDNLDRLESQINDYYKAFDHVAVVTYKKNISVLQEKIDLIGKPVGIYLLQHNGALTTIQKPKCYKNSLDKEVLFNILRKQEFETLLLDKKGFVPDTSDFLYYKECKKIFFDIPIDDSYNRILQLLKKRCIIVQEEYYKIPYELKFLAYFMNLTINEYDKIYKFLNVSYKGV